MSEIRIKLEKIKNEIVDYRKKIYNYQKEKKKIENDLRTISTAIKSSIMNEVDDKNKAKYSNQQKRDVEFASRIDVDDTYKAKSEELEYIDVKIHDVEIKIEDLRYSFRLEEIISRLGSV